MSLVIKTLGCFFYVCLKQNTVKAINRLRKQGTVGYCSIELFFHQNYSASASTTLPEGHKNNQEHLKPSILHWTLRSVSVFHCNSSNPEIIGFLNFVVVT